MAQNTSSPKNYNIMALRGANITDEEYVETFGLDPTLAHTPALNEAMLDMVMQQNIDGGMEEKKAKQTRMSSAGNIKKLLAQNGMLK